MKFKKETVRKLEEAFAIGADVSAACYYANISRETYYRWIKERPNLKEKYDRLREKPVLKAYQTVSQDLGNTETAKWYLTRKRNKEFSEKILQEQSGDINLTFKWQNGKDNNNSLPTEENNQ